MSRATKSGFAREAHEKVLAKYDVKQSQEALEWVSHIIEEEFDTSGEMENFKNQLRDGSKLCKACKDYGLIDAETFQTVDLWDGENLHQVCVCLHALGRKAQKNGLKGLGPKEAERNERQFTEEQLKEGSKIISLQYGTNKHANQSGINFGNTRHM